MVDKQIKRLTLENRLTCGQTVPDMTATLTVHSETAIIIHFFSQIIFTFLFKNLQHLYKLLPIIIQIR